MAYSGFARAMREAYMNPLISTGISFAVQLYSQQLGKNFSTTPNHFHAPKMVVFVETEYIYKPTPSRSKNTTTRRKPGPEQLSTLNKLQHIKSSGASLSTPRPAAAARAGTFAKKKKEKKDAAIANVRDQKVSSDRKAKKGRRRKHWLRY